MAGPRPKEGAYQSSRPASPGEGYLHMPDFEYMFSDVVDTGHKTVLLQFQGRVIFGWVAWD